MPYASLTGRVLLVVEDDHDLRESIVDAAKRSGARVLDTSSGSEALDLLHTTTLDAMIVDMILPEIRGIDLIPKASELGVSIVAISGDPGLKASGVYHHGAHVFIRKPFTLADVVDATARHLPLKRTLESPESANYHRRALSGREMQILGLIKRGYETSQISAILGISKNTVAFHRKSIRRKHQQLSFIEICDLYFR